MGAKRQVWFWFTPLCSLQSAQAVNPGPRRSGCSPAWSGAWQREGRGHRTLPGQASLQKHLLKKLQLHPKENQCRERSPVWVCRRMVAGSRGNACGCREPSTSTRSPCCQALASTSARPHQAHLRVPGRDGWLGKATGTGAPVPGRRALTPSVGTMGCWRVPSTVLAFLLLLRPLPSAACPAACHCSSGEVDCSQHALSEVPRNLSTNTSTLWLGYNFITVLGPRSFPLLPGLLLLSLPHNRLEQIHSRALVGLRALKELDLSHNYLTVLTSETFLPLTSLAMLNLGSNRLGELEPRVLRALPQLQALLLQDNPWVCSCGILPLWRWLSHNTEKVRGECPENRVPKPPTHSTLAGHPAGAEAGPS